MAKEKKQSRKDAKGRVLRKGESQRKDGTYMYRYMDECKKRHSVYAKTLPELREKALKIEKDRMDDIHLSTDYTVDQLVRSNLKIRENINRLSYNTLILDIGTYNSHIKDSWLASKKVKDVKKSDIILFYTDLSKTLKNSSIRSSVHKLLSQTFKLALEDHMIRSNPTTGVLENFPDDVKEKTILTASQLNDLANYVKNNRRIHKWYTFIIVITETMTRGSELCGLTWDNVDFEKKTITIDHQILRRKKNGQSALYARPPKTKNGYREIPLTTKAYQALILQKEFQITSNLSSTVVVDGYSDFVFTTFNGRPQTIQNVNDSLGRIEKCYNKDNIVPIPHLTCHMLRHTGCSIMAKKMFKLGLDPKILQKWMGHSSLKMTMDLYNHAEDEDSEIAINLINGLSMPTTEKNLPILLAENK